VAPLVLGSANVETTLLLLKIAFLVLLYLFIWRIVRSAARDLRLPQESMILSPQQASALLPQPAARARGQLVVVASPALEQGEVVTLDSHALRVGRGGDNELPIELDEYASSHHARFEPRREPTPPADLFRAARENLRPIASSRSIAARVEPDCPDLDVDPSLALEILVNLIENAHRASPGSAPIELAAAPHPSDPSRVRLEVLDRGRGLTEAIHRLGALGASPETPASGDVPRKGLGLEIARSFAAAHDSHVVLLPREGGGVCARIDMPAAEIAGLTVALTEDS